MRPSGQVPSLEIETPYGAARAHLHPVERPRAVLVLGHGAGGGVAARDLVTAAGAAREAGVSTVLVEQPYRVGGRRSPPPAHQLDAAWIAVVEHLRARELDGLALITGGRSSGARVACRTAAATGAAAVVCLAFPLQPPRRRDGSESPSRLGELESAGVPVLVVQGAHDRFGVPPPGPRRTVVEVAGDHSLRSDLGSLADAVREWLPQVLPRAAGARARR